ncbi:hypothetical protein DSL72_004077 [Monilinia vaccinii-corymbosi]|uniref:Uncharacterized protein n=1 Tax=Monilinia vaccinii-corymbosi TaxID=61207 RepID=A0A8A3NYE0_9HELO|nr:hypothetical protein DSL72_004077 [Monilinia vaccinii-corymbosi]
MEDEAITTISSPPRLDSTQVNSTQLNTEDEMITTSSSPPQLDLNQFYLTQLNMAEDIMATPSSPPRLSLTQFNLTQLNMADEMITTPSSPPLLPREFFGPSPPSSPQRSPSTALTSFNNSVIGASYEESEHSSGSDAAFYCSVGCRPSEENSEDEGEAGSLGGTGGAGAGAGARADAGAFDDADRMVWGDVVGEGERKRKRKGMTAKALEKLGRYFTELFSRKK